MKTRKSPIKHKVSMSHLGAPPIPIYWGNSSKVHYWIKTPNGLVGPYASKHDAEKVKHFGDTIVRRKKK